VRAQWERMKRLLREEIKEKAYLKTTSAADRKVFSVLEEMVVANCVSARSQSVRRIVFASQTLRATDAEAHVGPSLGNDGVAGAAR
jgi:hypothetical protein